MDKRKPSEAVLAKNILLLRQKNKQQKKEERIFMKRNKKLVNEIQSHKETLKSLNDERLALQKDIYDKRYTKNASEGNNNALKNSLSSCLNHLHALQTKIINSCIETQRESPEGNRHSSKKPAESCPQESREEQTISEEPCRQSRSSSPLQDVSSSQESILVCKVEALNAHEVKPVLSSHCDLTESKQELSLLLSSFCRRDTVPLNKNTGLGYQGSENVPLERTCEPDFQESEKLLLERTCEPDYQESENVPFEKTCKPDFQESETVSLEITCVSSLQKSENVSLGRTCATDLQLENETFERLSVKGDTLDSLRNYEIPQSLTVFESNPEITAKESTITSILEVDLLKHYNIQQLEISIPRLDLSAYPSLNDTIEIPKKDVSRGRKIMKSTQNEDRNQRDTTPDSASESSNNGRALRRTRKNAVSYKEKPLKTKLRRS